MVITRDSESLNPSSSLGRPFLNIFYLFLKIKQKKKASLAQWIAHKTSNLGVAGSSPARGVYIYFFFIYIYKTKKMTCRSSHTVPGESPTPVLGMPNGA